MIVRNMNRANKNFNYLNNRKKISIIDNNNNSYYYINIDKLKIK